MIYSFRTSWFAITSTLVVAYRKSPPRQDEILTHRADQLRETRHGARVQTLLFQIRADRPVVVTKTFSFFPLRKEEKEKEEEKGKKLYLSLRCAPSESRSDLVCSSPCTCMHRDRCFCRRDAAPAYRSGTLPDVDSSVTPSRL